MSNLISAIIPYRTTFWLLVVLGILVIIEILIFAILNIRRGNKSKERRLVGITLDTENVQRNFTAGDEFNCVGLAVQANYDLNPTSENIVDCVMITERELDEVISQNEYNCYYIVKPNMYKVGKKIITVIYQDKASIYSIEITDYPMEDIDSLEEDAI